VDGSRCENALAFLDRQAWGTVPLPCNSSGPWAKLQLSPFEHCPWFWKYRHSMVLKLPWIAAQMAAKTAAT